MLINTPATNYTKTKLAGDIVLATALLPFARIFDFDFGLGVGFGYGQNREIWHELYCGNHPFLRKTD